MPTPVNSAERPAEMFAAGRGVNASFADGDEQLYRRCDPVAIEPRPDGGLRVIGQKAFADFNPSTVRSLYAEPDHARWDSAYGSDAPDFVPLLYRDWYVVALRVRDLPKPMSTDGGVYEFGPAHVPLEDNYAHSEIRVRKDGAELTEAKKFKSKTVKAQYRTWLGDKATVRLNPYVIREVEHLPAVGGPGFLRRILQRLGMLWQVWKRSK